MNAPDRLRQLNQIEESRLRAGIPPDRESALVALARMLDRRCPDRWAESLPDVITGHRLAAPGAGVALRLCLESCPSGDTGMAALTDAELDEWAAGFLDGCGTLAGSGTVLAHCERGFMRLVEDAAGTLHAWIVTKRAPTGWRERMDVDWWRSMLAARHVDAMRALAGELRAGGDAPGRRSLSRKLAELHLESMAYQLGYPRDALLGGLPVEAWLRVVRELIGHAVDQAGREREVDTRSERDLVSTVASMTGLDPGAVARAVGTLALDADGAAWHAAVPGVAVAPLVRTGGDRVILSRYGLLTEPLFFLTRELRRRDSEAYHNLAHLREDVFRRDLRSLFGDRRFVTGEERIRLRQADGRMRTDIDAAVFDRKTGTLGVFELKSQDPFARTAAELERQRDNVLDANRQVGGVLDWLNRHGGDEILSRIDRKAAKTFRVQRVYPFVLGRYLVRFTGGPEPDRRAAWGTWPQVLRLVDGRPLVDGSGNPIGSLFTRLKGDDAAWPEGELTTRSIEIGDGRLLVHPSYGAYQAWAGVARGSRS